MELPDDIAACIKDMTVGYSESPDASGEYKTMQFVRYTFYDKLNALSMIAKHLNMFPTTANIQVSQNVGINWDAIYKRGCPSRDKGRD